MQCNDSRQAAKGCNCINESGEYYYPQYASDASYYDRETAPTYYNGRHPEGTVAECHGDFTKAFGNDRWIAKLKRQWATKGYDPDGKCDIPPGREKPSPPSQRELQRNRDMRKMKDAWQWLKSLFN